MIRRSKANRRGSWKLERASVHRHTAPRPRSNKYSGSDADTRPARHSRKGVWVGGYRRQDGTHVQGYYRTNAQYLWRK